MEPQIISKRTAIELIVDDDVDTIEQRSLHDNDTVYLKELLQYGHEGYISYTIDKLQNELDNRFDSIYEINPEL